MTAIIDSLCRELRNFFIRGEVDGTFTISGGALLPGSAPGGSADDLPLHDGQYYYIGGSLFNDGVHRWPEEQLVDETFDGYIWLMAPPRDFLALAEDIAAYRARIDELSAAGGGFRSESFGDYSYTLSTDAPSDVVELRDRILAGKRRWRKIL